jgi:hypothetical protein
MAKVKKTQPQKSSASNTSKQFTLNTTVQNYIFIVLIAITVLFILKPFVIDRLSPQGVDVIGSIGKSHQLAEYKKENGERALWNPYIFAGMPVYHRFSAQVWSVDNLISYMSRLFTPIYLYYLIAALGLYALLRYLKFSPLISFSITLMYILMPHMKSLFLEGHMAKVRALSFLPWVVLSFKYFSDKRNLTAMALFALAFGLQIRTQHYQIVFYGALLVFTIGVFPFLKDLFQKKYARFAKSTAMLLAAIFLGLLMAAQPLLLAKEYLPYSKRGKTTIDVKNQTTGRSAGGVSMDYATQWSTHPAELLTWLVPRFYGGMSAEKYDGSQSAIRKGQIVPGYWGYMPFTQSYEYFGVVCLLLAALGIFSFRRDPFVLSMIIFSAFLILLSFGRHFGVFYGFFYHYFPYFNKFRVPMTSVTVNFYLFAIFAAYGLKYLSENINTGDFIKKNKPIFIILGSFFGFGLILWLWGQSFSFVKPSGEPYEAQTLEVIKKIRAEFFTTDLMRYLLLVLLSAGLIIGYLKKKINFVVLALILTAVAVVDLVNIQSRVHKKTVDRSKLEKQHFRETSLDKILKKDKTLFRIFPAGKLFGDNRWAYFHQTIGGYSPIKMFTIEELVEKNIYNGPDKKIPINWNVLNILNVKYVILEGQINHPNLELKHLDKGGRLALYMYKKHTPRAFFVDGYEMIKDEYKRIERINEASFNPYKTAILEEKPTVGIQSPDSAFAKITSWNPNQISLDVYTDKQALLAISEVHYPPGWHIYIDGREVENIYKTNHAIQSIVVPAGNHKIELNFEPESFRKNIRLGYFSVGVIYLIIAYSLFRAFKAKKNVNQKK